MTRSEIKLLGREPIEWITYNKIHGSLKEYLLLRLPAGGLLPRTQKVSSRRSYMRGRGLRTGCTEGKDRWLINEEQRCSYDKTNQPIMRWKRHCTVTNGPLSHFQQNLFKIWDHKRMAYFWDWLVDVCTPELAAEEVTGEPEASGWDVLRIKAYAFKD